MLTKAVVTSLSVVLIATACGPTELVSDLPHAAALPGCGPADGPTTVILLGNEPIESAEPPFSHVRVIIWEPVSAVAGRSWSITSNTGPGAWFVGPLGMIESAISGRVSVTSVDSTSKVEGDVWLRFPSQTVAAEFSAHWLNSGGLCG